MKYFEITETDINVSPFEQVAVNAIRWVVGAIPRGTETAELNVSLMYIDASGEVFDMLYNYVLFIPKTILDQWLDDSVIDDFIIAESQGLFTRP